MEAETLPSLQVIDRTSPVPYYAQVKELAPIIFSPLVTLLGTCVAWYYASNKKD